MDHERQEEIAGRGKEQPQEKGKAWKFRVNHRGKGKQNKRAKESEGNKIEEKEEPKAVEKRNGGIWPKSKEINQSKGGETQERKQQSNREHGDIQVIL